MIKEVEFSSTNFLMAFLDSGDLPLPLSFQTRFIRTNKWNIFLLTEQISLLGLINQNFAVEHFQSLKLEA